MPVMSGEAALEKLKQIPNFSTPVIAVTADVLEQAPKKYLEKGFAAYISKPFTSEDIKEKLNDIYDKTYSKRDFPFGSFFHFFSSFRVDLLYKVAAQF